jgi:DNA-binding XRE family transcriptional regulator
MGDRPIATEAVSRRGGRGASGAHQGLTQEEFAEVLEMNQQAISRLERGVVSPSLTMVARVAVALRTRPSTLLRLAERIQVYAGGAGPSSAPVSTGNP